MGLRHNNNSLTAGAGGVSSLPLSPELVAAFGEEIDDNSTSGLSSSGDRVLIEDVTSHHTVVKSSRIKQILQVEGKVFFRRPEQEKVKRHDEQVEHSLSSQTELAYLPFELELSLPEEEVSPLDSLDSLYPESSDAISPFFFSSTPAGKESSEDDWSPVLSYREGELSTFSFEGWGTCCNDDNRAVALFAVTEAPVTSSFGPALAFIL
jgi:hypothetical protein